jgi:hypothetical protein
MALDDQKGDFSMTLAESLTERYPDHYQRIVECLYAEYLPTQVEYMLGREEAKPTNLVDLFVWASTPEGFDYWHALSGNVFKDPQPIP